MSRVLCTMPGRAGDILWALPSVRAIAEHHGDPVDLLIAGEFASMVPLLEQQPYLARVHADPVWNMAEWKPPGREDVISPYDHVYHLGYRRWPECPLPFEVKFSLAAFGWQGRFEDCPAPDLTRPWITVEDSGFAPAITVAITVGFTEAWFELKLGLLVCVEQALAYPDLYVLVPPTGGRWVDEAEGAITEPFPCTWLEAAQVIRNSPLFFGDCSALHVLAVGMGKPVVLMEPMEARWNDIFYPLGKTGPQVRLVTGNDGRPTFDARACADTLKEALVHAR